MVQRSKRTLLIGLAMITVGAALLYYSEHGGRLQLQSRIRKREYKLALKKSQESKDDGIFFV